MPIEDGNRDGRLTDAALLTTLGRCTTRVNEEMRIALHSIGWKRHENRKTSTTLKVTDLYYSVENLNCYCN